MEAKNIKSLLFEQKTRAEKKFGQNFLVDKAAIEKFIQAAGIETGDTILEIGPGPGNLTQELAKKAKRIVAIEKDREMIEILKNTLLEFKNVEVIQGDARNIRPETLMLGKDSYKVAANIPFYLTAYLIRQLLETKSRPKDITLVIQKEVAQRICAKPPDMNLLAVCVQFYGKPKIISYISKNSFWPSPKVDSAIIKIIPQAPLIKEPTLFFKIVKAGFSHPRKQILNNLANGLKLDKEIVKQWLAGNKIKPEQRAETLEVNDWLNLANNFNLKKAQ
jgi:16S rRNA (adenine1518-N6/adenine1519-N6)-dimethyltransferase